MKNWMDGLPGNGYKTLFSAAGASVSVLAFLLGLISADNLVALLGLFGAGGMIGLAHKMEKSNAK